MARERVQRSAFADVQMMGVAARPKSHRSSQPPAAYTPPSIRPYHFGSFFGTYLIRVRMKSPVAPTLSDLAQ